MGMPDCSSQDVLITDQLKLRARRGMNLEAERAALTHIARAMSAGSASVIQMLCDTALELCQAGSAGVSVLTHDRKSFDWSALSGRFAPYVGGSAPYDHSPCGTCLELDAAQLFHFPERYFEWLQIAKVPVFEGLVVPLYGEQRQQYGTIWVMKHDDGTQFDGEDLRIMQDLGGHMSIALCMLGWFEEAQQKS